MMQRVRALFAGKTKSSRRRRAASTQPKRHFRPSLERLEDRSLLATFLVTNTADSGPGSLGQAIVDANATSALDEIHFNLPGGGVHTISLTSGLPDIVEPVIIDGYTQPGASLNTLAAGSDAVLRIELHGNGATMTALRVSGGDSVVRGLVINGFAGDAIHIESDRNVIEGNYLGVNAAGTASVLYTGQGPGNGVTVVGSEFNTIGGDVPEARNVIAGNNHTGIEILHSDHNVVSGNFLGTDATGTIALGGGGIVIGEGASHNTIGGLTAGERNIISGNGIGIFISGFAGNGIATGEGNAIYGNYIGVDVTGLAALGNTNNGVEVVHDARNTIIGGTESGARNVISANQIGIRIGSPLTTAVIQGNYIGTDFTGAAPLGNQFAGIEVGISSNITIGGENPAEWNVIAFNGTEQTAAGIWIREGALNNRIAGNSIFANNGLGIDIGDDTEIFNGVNANDGGSPADTDDGANHLQNFPVLTLAATGGGTTTIAGSLDTDLPSTDYRIQFYSSPATDASGHGEGQTFLGGATFATDASGHADINVQIPVSVAIGHVITATATDPNGNTSEFSFAISVIELAEELPIITIDDVSVVEGDSGTTNAVFTVRLSAATSSQVKVYYESIAGLAKAGEDYSSTSGQLTFAPFVTSQTVAVSILGDPDEELNETLKVRLSGAVNAILLSGNNSQDGIGTILNDDDMPTLRLYDVSVVEGSGNIDSFAIMQFALSHRTYRHIEFQLLATGGTAEKGFAGTGDYNPAHPVNNDDTIFIPPGRSNWEIQVAVIHSDVEPELDETFFVTATQLEGAFSADTEAVVTIVNDEDFTGFFVSDASVVEGNSGTRNAVFTVTLHRSSSVVGDISATVNYATANTDAFFLDRREMALADEDYTARSGRLDFGPRTETLNIIVPVRGDTMYEFTHAFLLRLSSASGPPIVDGEGRGTIINDDPPPLVRIYNASAAEGNGFYAGNGARVTNPVRFALRREGPSQRPAIVNYRIVAGTATPSSDYYPFGYDNDGIDGNSGQVYIRLTYDAAIEVGTIADEIDEADETFFVQIFDPIGCVLANDEALGTIRDDDAPPRISIDDKTIVESEVGDVTAVFKVRLSQPSAKTVTVIYATIDGTAKAGSDYTRASGIVTFQPGEVDQFVSVRILKDTVDEDDELFYVNLRSATNGAIADNSGIGRIQDNDLPPAVSIFDAAIFEGNSGTRNMTFTVTLSRASAKVVQVGYKTSSNTAIRSSDFLFASGRLTFLPGETTKPVSVTIRGDTSHEGNETFFIDLIGPVNATLDRARALGTIRNDDFIGVP